MDLHDIIKIAMAEHPNNPDAVAKLVEESMCIRGHVDQFKVDMDTEFKRHESKIKELKQKIADVQKECVCPGGALTFHGDPSGGRDSFHRCRICGKEQ